MEAVEDGSVHLVVTSPPYPMVEMWDGLFGRMGCRSYDEMHGYLAAVWSECYRVLCDGAIACVNIGDATRSVNGSFRLYPNHARTIETFERLGFSTLPYILWKKPTTKPKYKGKGAFLGSGFLPPNAYVTLDCEYILLFRKGGLRRFPANDAVRRASRLTKEERDRWFTQIWEVAGARQSLRDRRAGAFPEEIPRRLVRMFSVVGDTVLDPFLGTGTTAAVAAELGRNAVGYEVDPTLLPLLRERLSHLGPEVRWDAGG